MKLKRIMALILCFAMVFSTMSFNVFAADGENTVIAVNSADAFQTALEKVEANTTILFEDNITVDTKITVPDDVIIDLNGKTLYVNVENSYYNNVTLKNGNIVLGKDDVNVCDGYFLVNAGKTLVLSDVNIDSADGGIKGYAVFHLKTGANLDLIDSELDIRDNEYSAGYIVYADEETATVDIDRTTVTGTNVNGIVHATTVIDNSTFTIADAVEHGINRSAVTIDDSTVAISGGTGRGITAQHGDLVISGNSVVNISDMGEATIELRDNKNLTVDDTATVTVDVAVNNTTNGTITGNVTVEGATEPPVANANVKIGEQGYETLADALEAASAMTGDVTVEIYNKVTLNQSLSGSYDTIKFVGKADASEIYLDVQGYITATGKKVAFEDLTLSKSEGGFVTNAGFMNLAFGVYDVTEVTYEKCIFSNGAYASSGVTTFKECTFYRSHDRYGLWAYGNVDAVVDGCTFADIRGVKMYAEGGEKTVNLTVKNTNFTAVDGKPAIVLTYGESVTLENNTYSSTGVFELDLDGAPNGTPVASDVAPTCKNDNGACGVLVDGKIYTTVAQAAEVATSGSTVTLLHDSAETVEFAEGVTLNKNGYTADEVTVKVSAVAKIGETEYATLAEAIAAVQEGETITMLADTTVSEDVTLPAGITLNGNGKEITGNVVAGGDLTIEGYTKISNFNAGYSKPTITIGAGATLETTSGRMVIGHGATFNITGSITDAKTADISSITPSLIAPGASFTGAGVNFNITNAYVKFTAYCSSKNSNANGTFDMKVTNSIWEQTGSLVFSEPTNSKDPTFNFNVKDSVLNSTSHLVFAVTKGDIVFDNSIVNEGEYRQLENRSTMTIKNGSVVYAAHATSSNAKNPGKTIVENATYTATGDFSGSDVGTGTLIVKKGANVTMGKITKANIVVDATGMAAGDTVGITADMSALAGTVSVINNNLEAEIEDGKIILIEKPVAQIGDVKYTDLQTALKALTSGATLTLLDDVTITEAWDNRYTGAKITVPVTIDGNGKTIKFTGTVADGGNYHSAFRFQADATVKNLTVDMSEAITTNNRLRAISSSANLTVDNCNFIGNANYTNCRAVIFGEGAGTNVGNLNVSITNSTFKNWRRGVSDNENAQDVKSVTLTGNTFDTAAVNLSATDTVTFTGNTVNGAYVDIRSYTAGNKLNVTATDNTLTANTETTYNYIKAGGTINAQGEFIVPATGSNSLAYTKEVDGYVRVWGEGGGNARESFVLKLYSDETLMATTQLNNVGGIINGNVLVTWNFFYPESNDEYWTTTWEAGHPNADAQPTKVELYIDGTLVATTDAKMSGADGINPVIWSELGGVKKTSLTGSGTEVDPYIINNIDDLKWFRDDVNAGNNYAGKIVTMTADIDLASEEWTPIGNSTNKFSGIFDGGNNTISNLVVNGGSSSNQGFFGFTTGGEIKNVIINNAKVSGRLNVGALAGTPYTSKYTNIKLTGHVEINGMAYVGGLLGKNAYANLTDITIDVDDSSYVKAISTENGTAYRTYVGGVVGFIGEGSHKVSNVTSNINVYGDVCDIGGISGIAHYGNTFENCKATGKVECEDPEETEVGGIAGVWHNEKGTSVTFTNCKYEGSSNVPVVGAAYNAGNDSSENSGTLVVDGVQAWPVVAKIGETGYGTLEAAFNAAQDGDVVIELLDDVTLDYNAREAYGTVGTTSLTINGNGHTMTLNQKDSDWSSVGLANADAKLVLNNMTIEKTGYGDTDGAWNTHAINFTCEVEMNDVTVNQSMSVEDGATLNNVTINEANGYYGLWIDSNGQTVNVTGGAINATNGGRGIKIADEYVDSVKQVILTVGGTKFNTAKKAAVLVSSTAGAKVTANNADITNVAQDKENFVWVDEDWAAYYNNVKVYNEATKTQESEESFPIKVWYVNGEGVRSSVRAYYKTLDELFAAPATQVPGNNYIDLRGDVVANNKVDVSYGSNRVYTFGTDVEDGITMDFKYADNWNMLPKFDLGENITLNVPYLQVIGGDIEISGTINTGYLYLYGTGEGVTITETGIVNANVSNDKTVQIKGGTVLTVNGTLNTGTLNVWTQDVNNSELIVSGEKAEVNVGHLHAWNGKDGVSAQKVVVENGATLVATNFQADRGSEVTVDAATLTADTLTLGYGDNIGKLVVLNNGVITNGVVLNSTAATLVGPENMNVTTNLEGYTVVYENGVYKVAELVYVATVTNAQGVVTNYTTLAEAVSAANAGDTVTVIKDIEVSEHIVIAADQTVVLDLNGYTISSNIAEETGAALITNKGNLTIKDSGENGKILVTVKTPDGADTPGYASNTITNMGTLVIERGTIENTGMGSACYPIDNNSTTGDAIVTVDGGKVIASANSYAIRMFANSTAKNDVTINGGELSGYRAVWLQLPGGNDTVEPDANLTITDGVLASVDTTYNSAIYVRTYGNSYANTDITISGGTFNGDIALTGPSSENLAVTETVSVTGGTFNGANGIYTYSDSLTGVVSGGTFKVKIDEDLLAEGYEFVQNEDGTFGVQEVVEKFKIAGTVMNLGNALNMKFFVRDEDCTEGIYAKVVRTTATGTLKETVIPYSEWTVENNYKGYKIFTYKGVAAKEMTDILEATVYNADGKAISETLSTSVRKYAMNIVNDPDETEVLKTLAVDMLNYGAQSQIYFNYGTSDLANSSLTEEQKEYASTEYTFGEINLQIPPEFLGTILTLESNILMKLYIDGITENMTAKIEFTDGYGNEKTINVASDEFVTDGSYKYVVVDELAVADYKSVVTCTVYDGDQEYTVLQKSVEHYLKTELEKANPDPIFDMVMKFVASADKYFHNK